MLAQLDESLRLDTAATNTDDKDFGMLCGRADQSVHPNQYQKQGVLMTNAQA